MTNKQIEYIAKNAVQITTVKHDNNSYIHVYDKEGTLLCYIKNIEEETINTIEDLLTKLTNKQDAKAKER